MKLVIVFAALLACAAASHMRAKQMLWQDAQQERENQRALNHAQRYNPSDTRELEHEDVNNQAQDVESDAAMSDSVEEFGLAQDESFDELPATEMETDTSNGELEQEPDDSLASLKERMAKLMYQNQWDQVLNYKCPTGSAVYRVQSVHNNAKEDRLWQFTCKRVNPNQCQQPRCTTSSYINNFRDYISFMCGRNQYMAGVYSYHDNGKEDRRWRFTCCSLPSYISRECYLTGYVNGYDGAMNFNAGGNGFITGVVSEYSTGHRDRRFKFAVCRYKKDTRMASTLKRIVMEE